MEENRETERRSNQESRQDRESLHDQSVTRRDLCKSLGVVTGASSLSSLPELAAGRESETSVTFPDQQLTDQSLVVDVTIGNLEKVFGYIENQAGTIVGRFEVSESKRGLEVAVTEVISESQEMTAVIVDSDVEFVDKDTASITVDTDVRRVAGIESTLIEADPDAGFNYPYYLYAPETRTDAQPPLLVQPNNPPKPTDDFEFHRQVAEETVNGSTGRDIAVQLRVPLLVPVFPRPRSDPVDNTHLVTALDDTTMELEDGPLARVDRQLLAMVDDAYTRLEEQEYPVASDRGIMLNGFSASGNFVERFAALHPEEVLSVTAGGVNGMPILPIERMVRTELEYFVGVADVEELTESSFDLEEFNSVNRFLYMGEFDDSDTIPFSDTFTEDALRETALDVYGPHMIDDRFAYSNAVYEQADSDTVFRVYRGAGHTPSPASDDLVRFHERSIAGDDSSALEQEVGGNVPTLGPHIERSHESPAPGTEVTFDAGRSFIAERSIAEYTWSFGDGRAAMGEVVTHTFETTGGHNVVLTVTDESGATHATVTQVTVNDEVSTEITVTDQQTDGRSLTVENLTLGTEIGKVELLVFDSRQEPLVNALLLTESAADFEIFFNRLLTRSQTVTVEVYEPDGSRLAETSVAVAVEQSAETVDAVGPTLVEANPEAGFNYPYFLYGPETTSSPRPLLVEPNNTGTATDDFSTHREAARRLIEGETGRQVADKLNAPFVVPVFPRPENEPVDFTHNVHLLDDTTMEIDDGPLARVDRQLLAMVDDAYDRLEAQDYPVARDRGIMLNGFSASGSFVDRFAALHPEEILSVTAGGVNGMSILPVESAIGADGTEQTVNYPVGVANVDSLTGKEFDRDEFASVKRFIYMGEIDVSDTIPYFDSWTDTSLRETALSVYGRNMQTERFPSSRAVHERVGTATVFRMYDRVDHTPRPAAHDVVTFHERAIRGASETELRAEFQRKVPNRRAAVQLSSYRPQVGTQVAAHAMDAELRTASPVEYQWQFEDVEKTGPAVVYRFSTPGVHAVTLTVTDSDGNTETATEYVTVVPAEAPESTSDGSDTDETDNTGGDGDRSAGEADESETGASGATDEESGETQPDDSDDASGPGMTVTSAVSALGGTAYVLKRRLARRDRDDDR